MNPRVEIYLNGAKIKTVTFQTLLEAREYARVSRVTGHRALVIYN